MKALTFSKGGIHPPQNKSCAGMAPEYVALPRRAVLLMSQHLGAPGVPVVAKGDRVERGGLVGRAGGRVSAAVHSPVSGIVADVRPVKTIFGVPDMAVIIDADSIERDEKMRREVMAHDSFDFLAVSPDELITLADAAGIVGLGGATFPSQVKLCPPPGCEIDTLVVNGAECEPYLTCDDSLMRYSAREIVSGVCLMMRACGASRAVIGIEDNKPEAIAAMSEAVARAPFDVAVQPLVTKYPQGGEKQLIKALTGREVASGALPASVGVVVQNVATARALWRAAAADEPLTQRIVTVAGPGIRRPGNYIVAVGTPLCSVVEAAGGMSESASKVIIGGPMMGRTAEVLTAPTVKGVSGVLVFEGRKSLRGSALPCIRCGRCVEACPMRLEPFLVSTLGRRRMLDEAVDSGMTDCMECGCCSYVCPSNRPILDYIRLGKRLLADRRRAEQQTKSER